MKKQWIAAGMVLVLLIAMLPPTYRAAGESPGITWICREVPGKKGVYVLKGRVRIGCGVRSITTVLNFDGDMIQPVAGSQYREYVYHDGDTTAGNTVRDRLSYMAQTPEDRAYTATTHIRIIGSRTALSYTLTAVEDYPRPLDQEYMEFFFRLKKGKTWEDADCRTFALETIDGIGPGLAIEDTDGMRWQYGGSSAGENPIPADRVTIQYTNSDRPAVKPEITAATVNKTAYHTVQEAVDAAGSFGGTVVLACDREENVTIPGGSTVQMELAGHRLTGTNDSGTIFCEGTLTLGDSTGRGSVVGTAGPAAGISGEGSLTVREGVVLKTEVSSGAAVLNQGTGIVHIRGGQILGGASAVEGRALLDGGYYRADAAPPCRGEITFAEGMVMSEIPLVEGIRRGLYFVGPPEEICWMDGDGSILGRTFAAYGTSGDQLAPPEGRIPQKPGLADGTTYSFSHWLLPERVLPGVQIQPVFRENGPSEACTLWLQAPEHGDRGAAVRVSVFAGSAEGTTMESTGFALDLGSGFWTADSIVPSDGLRGELSPDGGEITLSAEHPEGIPLLPEGTKLAELQLRAVETGKGELAVLPGTGWLRTVEGSNAAVSTGAGSYVDIHDLRVKLSPGEGCTINGRTSPMTAYVKYGAPGMYRDPGRTLPVDIRVEPLRGYRLEEPLWSDGQQAYSSEELMTAVRFAKNTMLTARTVKRYLVTFDAAPGGSLEGDMMSVEVDRGTRLCDIVPPEPKPDKGYRFDGWKIFTTSGGIPYAEETVGCQLTWVAQFSAVERFSVTWPQGAEGPQTVENGTDLVFVPSLPGKVVTGVKVTVDGNPAAKVSACEGVYTVAVGDIVGNITVEFITLDGSWQFISCGAYHGLAPGTKLAILRLDRRESQTLADGGEMFWSEAYGGLVSIVPEAETEAALSARLRECADNAAIRYDGNLNGSLDAEGLPSVTAADTLPVRAVLWGMAPDGYVIDDRMRLEMDVNGDGVVTTADIQWILDRAAQMTLG